jgi:UDP-N-acetylglucosamine 3-dehydrogenase
MAVFGAGYWGTKLCREYMALGRSTKDALLGWVVDSSDSALESIRSKLGQSAITFSKDYQAVLASREIDAVHIALPTTLHYKSARAALEAGKHVLLEKPMALSSREAFKLASLAEERGLVLQVGHIFRFNAALRMARKMIQEGYVGDVFYAKLEWTTSEIPSGERDIVFDLAPHPIDVLNYLLDEWPVGVDAVGESYHRRKESLEEMAFINLEFPDRITANIYLSWIQPGGKERVLRVVGENGTLFCDALSQTVALQTKKGESKVPASQFPRIGNGHELESKGEEGVPNNAMRDMQIHFIDTIRGRGPQFNSALIGARNVEVLEAITRAMRAKNGAQTHQQYPPISSLEGGR